MKSLHLIGNTDIVAVIPYVSAIDQTYFSDSHCIPWHVTKFMGRLLVYGISIAVYHTVILFSFSTSNAGSTICSVIARSPTCLFVCYSENTQIIIIIVIVIANVRRYWTSSRINWGMAELLAHEGRACESSTPVIQPYHNNYFLSEVNNLIIIYLYLLLHSRYISHCFKPCFTHGKSRKELLFVDSTTTVSAWPVWCQRALWQPA